MEKLLFANERVKEFEIQGEVQGQKVKGKFKAKYPSVLDTLQIQKENSNLIQDANPETLANLAYDMAYMMAYLNVLLIEKPEWFNYEIIDNIDVLINVYDEVNNFVSTFRSGNGEDKHSDDGDKAVAKKTVEGK